MTWQRIDENTYIDDTLVTCAEYQLFIDEMRAQGKYYQPDHWTSHQFPSRRAWEPILGVRCSDALDFCEWLTKREAGEWKYRLSLDAEAMEYQITKIRQTPIGYWTINSYGNSSAGFAWIGKVPGNVRNLDNKKIDAVVQDRNSQNRPLDLNNHRVTSNKLGIEREPVINFLLDRMPNRDFDGALEIADGLYNARNRTFPEAKEFFADLYIDLITLHERIAGRSPAFEGIRLVKERIR